MIDRGTLRGIECLKAKIDKRRQEYRLYGGRYREERILGYMRTLAKLRGQLARISDAT